MRYIEEIDSIVIRAGNINWYNTIFTYMVYLCVKIAIHVFSYYFIFINCLNLVGLDVENCYLSMLDSLNRGSRYTEF